MPITAPWPPSGNSGMAVMGLSIRWFKLLRKKMEPWKRCMSVGTAAMYVVRETVGAAMGGDNCHSRREALRTGGGVGAHGVHDGRRATGDARTHTTQNPARMHHMTQVSTTREYSEHSAHTHSPPAPTPTAPRNVGCRMQFHNLCMEAHRRAACGAGTAMWAWARRGGLGATYVNAQSKRLPCTKCISLTHPANGMRAM